jgi:2-dehydro-3-deoxyphosphooctonate aldolase (KDO 8-P synthase)
MKISDIIPDIKYADSGNFFLIAGPCVVENEEICNSIAKNIIALSDKYTIPFIFKSSYKKANRTKLDSFTGIGDKEALEILKGIKNRYQIPVLTDIHTPEEVYFAFLSRQTELLVAAAKTGKTVNIKKGQFMAPLSMKFALDKVVHFGNRKVILTERGTMFGYNDLVVDYRGIREMQEFGHPVVLDITHSLQQPNQDTGVSGGRPDMIETIALAGVAVGVDGIFIETHPHPDQALSDGTNMLKLDFLESLLVKLLKVRKVITCFET